VKQFVSDRLKKLLGPTSKNAKSAALVGANEPARIVLQ
jgi:hypothetical protein